MTSIPADRFSPKFQQMAEISQSLKEGCRGTNFWAKSAKLADRTFIRLADSPI